MNTASEQLVANTGRMMRSATVTTPGPNVPRLGRLIPVPDIPVEPVLSLSAFKPAGRSSVASVMDCGPITPLVAGRYAIAWALKLMGVCAGEKILMPSYHCATMVEPLSTVGAEPVFYRLNDDLSADLDDIRAKLSSDVRAILATHYFGFPQIVDELRTLCDNADIGLIEDCAHCFFGLINGRPVGAWGDYAIASPRKFFPIQEGGFLIDNSRVPAKIALTSAGFLAAAKSTFNFVQHSASYGRITLAGNFAEIAHKFRQVLAGQNFMGPGHGNATDQEETDGEIKSEYDASLLDRKMALPARLIRAMVSKERAIRCRRQNYQKLLNGLTGLPGCHPLKPELQDSVVPHMFPLWIDELDRVFPNLEDMAVPMQRFGQFLWRGIDETVCSTSYQMSHHLVQFPCHQDLTATEVDSIVGRVRSCLTRPAHL